MILFAKDWGHYPTAIADDKTTNTEWLRLASLYKSMGIKNYYFHLALYQPELQGVDPYSDNLTSDQKAMIALEVEYNPWYFFREVLRVPNGSNPLKFKANRGVISLLWCFFVGIDYALNMIRQTGKSVGCEGLEVWLVDFYYRNTDLLLYTKDDDLRKKSIARIKETQALLPKWLSPWSKKDADNGEVFECSARGNILKTKVGQAAIFLAEGAGRGLTMPYVRVDEGPFIPNAHISIPAIIAGTSANRENNEETGTLYGNLFVTTVGKLQTKEGKYMYNFMHSGMPWNEALLDCIDKYQARDTVRLHSPKDRCLVHGVFSHRQLGKTDAWLRNRISLAEATPDEIARDWFNQWTSGTESSALSTTLLEIVRKSEMEPVYTSTEKYMVCWYIDKMLLLQYLNTYDFVAGLDSSDAIGRDATALVLTDTRDLAVVGVCVLSEGNLENYGVWLAKMLVRYTKITLIIEAKSSARALTDVITATLMVEGVDPFKRMYNHIVDDHKTRQAEYDEICKPLVTRSEQVYLKNKKDFGFNTSGNTRQFLFDTVMNDAVQATAHLIRNVILAEELKSLIIKNGKVMHPSDGHDDCVVAWLLTHWFVKHSKNLSHYGINTLTCLTLVSNDGATMSNEDIAKREMVAQLNVEIGELKQVLSSSPNIIEGVRAEKLLAHKVKQINELGDYTLNLDQIMKSINESKVSRRDLRTAILKANANKMGALNR